MMKIALFCTQDDGGAGKASLRLNNGLNLIGEDSTLFVKRKTTDNQQVIQLQSPEINNAVFEKAVWKYFYTNVYEGNTICSAMYPSVGFDYLEKIHQFDIINLHWIPSFLSLEAIAEINRLGKPIVWTLHDQNPMTGACHYTHGCDKYQTDCSDCPQLKVNSNNITRTILETKIKYLPKTLTVVTPSLWLAKCAKESAVFKKHRIEVIPNSVETDIFWPSKKSDAKISLGLPADAKVILFGAQDLKEKRKGMAELVKITKLLWENGNINELVEANKVWALVFGYHSPLLDELGIPYQALGYVNEDQKLSLAYSASDVLALPSLEDNLPNLMLESMACGTPVVAFKTGGMASTIIDGQNGYLVPLKDLKQFTKRIIDVITGTSMEASSRSFAEQNYRLEIQASKYKDLFHEVINGFVYDKYLSISKIFPETASVMGSYIGEASVEMQNDLNQLFSDREFLGQERNRLLQELDQLKCELDQLKYERDSLKQELQVIYFSRSWKLVTLLRLGWKIVRKSIKFILPYAIVRYYQKKR